MLLDSVEPACIELGSKEGRVMVLLMWEQDSDQKMPKMMQNAQVRETVAGQQPSSFSKGTVACVPIIQLLLLHVSMHSDGYHCY